MEKLDSVIVTLALKMKEIVMLMMSVKMVLLVDQTIVQFHLVLTLKLIAVLCQVCVLLFQNYFCYALSLMNYKCSKSNSVENWKCSF